MKRHVRIDFKEDWSRCVCMWKERSFWVRKRKRILVFRGKELTLCAAVILILREVRLAYYGDFGNSGQGAGGAIGLYAAFRTMTVEPGLMIEELVEEETEPRM